MRSKPPRYQTALLQQRKRTLLQPWLNSWAPRVLDMLPLLRHYPVPRLPQRLLDHRDLWTRRRLLHQNLLKKKTNDLRLWNVIVQWCGWFNKLKSIHYLLTENDLYNIWLLEVFVLLIFLAQECLWTCNVALPKPWANQKKTISKVWMQFYPRPFRELNWLYSVKTSTLVSHCNQATGRCRCGESWILLCTFSSKVLHFGGFW